MDEMVLGLAWLGFGGTHTILALVGVRRGLIGLLGKNGFRGVYSVISFLTFGFLIYAFFTRHTTGIPLWSFGESHVVFLVANHVLMFLAFALLFGGVFNKTPMGMIPAIPRPVGVTRITRHPMNMAFALFGLAHLLTNRLTTDWIFYGGFVLFGMIGSMHQDRKKSHQTKGALDEFIAQTSIVPFWAILRGKQSVNFAEFSKLGLVLALAMTVLARVLHPGILNLLKN